MILEVYSVHDKAVKAFMQPFFSRSRGEAIRSFTEVVNTKDHQFQKHAADYVLFYLGRFDDASGLFEDVEPLRIVGAMDVLVDDIFPPERRAVQAPEQPLSETLRNGRG